MSSLNARSIINATSRDTGYAHESLGGVSASECVFAQKLDTAVMSKDTNPNNINQIVSSKSARPTQVRSDVSRYCTMVQSG